MGFMPEHSHQPPYESTNTTSRSELPNMREKILVMNVHKQPSIKVPAKISHEMSGSGSGNTLSILIMCES